MVKFRGAGLRDVQPTSAIIVALVRRAEQQWNGVLHARVSDALATTGRPVTFSMGALIVPPDEASAFEPLMEEADQLLYAAKRQGRNTVVVAAAGTDGADRRHGATAGQTAAGVATSS